MGNSESGKNIPNSIHEIILNRCKRNPEHPALIGFGGEGTIYNYGQLENLVTGVAEGLRKKGVSKKSRIGILSENCPEWAVAYLAILAAGATVAPFDTLLKENELTSLLRKSEISLLFCTEKLLTKIDEIIKLNDFKIELICLNDEKERNLEKMVEGGNYFSTEVQPDDAAVIIFTSGTTGDPKGVILTHGNIVSNIISIFKACSFKPDDIFLSLLPMYHTFEATTGFLSPLYKGLSIVYARALNSRDIFKDIKSNQVTCMVATPLLYEKMYNTMQKKIKSTPAIKRGVIKTLYSICKVAWTMNQKAGKVLFKNLREKAGLANIRMFISGGAPLPPIIAEWFNMIGFDFLEGYGMTECSPVISVNRPDNIRFGSVGPPIPGVEVAIENPTPEGIGEVKVKGPNTTPGYLDNPEATAELLMDGWLYTGDLGKIENGSLYITGRMKNLIVSGGGKNIYPEEIESELNISDFIDESLIFGRKKEKKTGEQICALIVPDVDAIENAEGGKPNAEKIREIINNEIQAVNNRMADYKRIEKIEIRLEEFEKTSTKKIKRTLYK